MLVTRLSRDLAQVNALVMDATQNWEKERAGRRSLEQQLDQCKRDQELLLGNISKTFALLIEFQGHAEPQSAGLGDSHYAG